MKVKSFAANDHLLSTRDTSSGTPGNEGADFNKD